MGIIELILIAIGLSMDAFAVSICKGLNMTRLNYKNVILIALFFGGFQALMPFIGWFLGIQFHSYIVSFDHWVAFALLTLIGSNMVYEAISNREISQQNSDILKMYELFVLAIATSIDALTVGITFAMLPNTNIILSVVLIGIITFAFSIVGVIIGNTFGRNYEKKAELTGGIILIIIGIKILLEHLGVLPL